jgi:hypothetical protein
MAPSTAKRLWAEKEDSTWVLLGHSYYDETEKRNFDGKIPGLFNGWPRSFPTDSIATLQLLGEAITIMAVSLLMANLPTILQKNFLRLTILLEMLRDLGREE